VYRMQIRCGEPSSSSRSPLSGSRCCGRGCPWQPREQEAAPEMGGRRAVCDALFAVGKYSTGKRSPTLAAHYHGSKQTCQMPPTLTSSRATVHLGCRWTPMTPKSRRGPLANFVQHAASTSVWATSVLQIMTVGDRVAAIKPLEWHLRTHELAPSPHIHVRGEHKRR